jgi:hypothetical protein
VSAQQLDGPDAERAEQCFGVGLGHGCVCGISVFESIVQAPGAETKPPNTVQDQGGRPLSIAGATRRRMLGAEDQLFGQTTGKRDGGHSQHAVAGLVNVVCTQEAVGISSRLRRQLEGYETEQHGIRHRVARLVDGDVGDDVGPCLVADPIDPTDRAEARFAASGEADHVTRASVVVEHDLGVADQQGVHEQGRQRGSNDVADAGQDGAHPLHGEDAVAIDESVNGGRHRHAHPEAPVCRVAEPIDLAGDERLEVGAAEAAIDDVDIAEPGDLLGREPAAQGPLDVDHPHARGVGREDVRVDVGLTRGAGHVERLVEVPADDDQKP